MPGCGYSSWPQPGMDFDFSEEEIKKLLTRFVDSVRLPKVRGEGGGGEGRRGEVLLRICQGNAFVILKHRVCLCTQTRCVCVYPTYCVHEALHTVFLMCSYGCVPNLLCTRSPAHCVPNEFLWMCTQLTVYTKPCTLCS